MTSAQQPVADALRKVALRLEAQRAGQTLDEEDLRETLLAVADELDPPVRQKPSQLA